MDDIDITCSTYGDTLIVSDGERGVWLEVTEKDAHNALIKLNDVEAAALRDWLITAYPLPKSVEAKPAKRKAPHGPQKYKGNGTHTWEETAEGTQRLRVPGGWIYNLYNDDNATEAAVFVPVPDVVGYSI